MGFKENNRTKGFYGDLIKTFSHRVNNRKNKKLEGVGTGEKKCLEEDWKVLELMR